MKKGISAILVVHNEEPIIRRCLESIKEVVDEILIIHDGSCDDKTIKICKEYTKNVFIGPRKKMAAMHLKFLFEKVKYEWVLKIDADEVLSKELRENIRELIKNPKADAYSFLWLFWDGKKEVTKKWPTKMALYKIAKISFLGFPHWDDPKINGKIINTDYKLEHKTSGGNIPIWKNFKKKGLDFYGPYQAKYTLGNFKDFDQFQYDRDDFPLTIKIRKNFPLLSAIPFAILAFFKIYLSEGAWKEGKVALKFAFFNMIYYFMLGLQVHDLKKNHKNL
ncbi:MAG: glycosyltransferase [Nanoarchaeota archaeon]|nr:glycosyltransferase [Nanoarchaeota archaeon]